MSVLRADEPEQELRRRARRAERLASRCPESSIFALIGPNGAGKSTLLNLLSGHLSARLRVLVLRTSTVSSGCRRTSACGSASRAPSRRSASSSSSRCSRTCSPASTSTRTCRCGNASSPARRGRFRDEAMELLAFVGLGDRAERSRGRAALRPAAHARDRPRARHAAEALHARRAGGRPERRRGGVSAARGCKTSTSEA